MNIPHAIPTPRTTALKCNYAHDDRLTPETIFGLASQLEVELRLAEESVRAWQDRCSVLQRSFGAADAMRRELLDEREDMLAVIKCARELYTAHRILVQVDSTEDDHYRAAIAVGDLADALRTLDENRSAGRRGPGCGDVLSTAEAKENGRMSDGL